MRLDAVDVRWSPRARRWRLEVPWALVERQRPRWRDQRDWLRVHGPELLAFTPNHR